MGSRMAKCKVCGSEYTKRNMAHVACSTVCAIEHAQNRRDKKLEQQSRQVRKEIREQREKMKSRADWLREAQAAVNAYRRELFRDEPCISCGRHHQGQYHAGHYLSRGAHPELRFVEENIWKQCQPCNVHLSGNQVAFRQALVKRIGIKLVEWLEGPHLVPKYTIEDAKAIKALYKAKLKQLKKDRA